MASVAGSRVRQAAKLAVVFLVVAPVLVQWGFVADLVPAVDVGPEVDAELLVRLAGLAFVVGVLVALVLQKRRARGQRASASAPERAADRRVEQTGVEESGEDYAPYAYNNQQRARREGERIRKRTEEIVESDRESRERR